MTVKWKYFIFLLTLITATIWLAVLFYPDSRLRLIACDVGQGDAILAISGKTQILIDGGPNSRVIKCLDRYIPFWLRKVNRMKLKKVTLPLSKKPMIWGFLLQNVILTIFR